MMDQRKSQSATEDPSPQLPQLTFSSSIFDPIIPDQDEQMDTTTTDMKIHPNSEDNPMDEDDDDDGIGNIECTVEIKVDDEELETGDPEPIPPTIDTSALKIPSDIIISNIGFQEDENSIKPITASRLRAQKRKRYISKFLENERFTDVQMGTLIVGLPNRYVDYSKEFGTGVDIFPEDNALEKLALDTTPQNTLANRLGQYIHLNKPLPKSDENTKWLSTPRLPGGIIRKLSKSKFKPRQNVFAISQPKFVNYVACESLSNPEDSEEEVELQLTDLEDPEHILDGISYKDLVASLNQSGNIIFGNGFDQSPSEIEDQDDTGVTYPFCVEPPQTKAWDEKRELIAAKYTEILENHENESNGKSKHWLEPLKEMDTAQKSRINFFQKLSSDIPKKFEKIAGKGLQKMIAWFDEENPIETQPSTHHPAIQQNQMEMNLLLDSPSPIPEMELPMTNPAPFIPRAAAPRKSPPALVKSNLKRTYIVQKVSDFSDTLQDQAVDLNNVEDDLFDYPVFEEVNYDENGKPPAPVKADKSKKPNLIKPDGDANYGRPGVPYSHIIFLALKNSFKGFLPVSELYAFFLDHFPYFQNAPLGWKNSIRHNLSLNRSFKKYIHRSEDLVSGKKGFLWTLCENPDRISRMESDLNKIFSKHPEMLQDTMIDPENLELLLKGELKRDYSTVYKEEEEEEPAPAPAPRPRPPPPRLHKKLTGMQGLKSFEDSPMFQGTLTQLRKFLYAENCKNSGVTDISSIQAITSPSEIMKSALDMYNEPPPKPSILRRSVHSSSIGLLKRN